MKRKPLIIIALILLLLTVFFFITKTETMPGVEIPIKDMNQELHIYVPKEANLFKIGDFFAVAIENLSEAPIHFSKDGIMVFEKNQEGWKQVEIISLSQKDEFQVLPKNEGILRRVIIGVYPNIENKEQTDLRFVIIGNKMKDGEIITDQQVGGYVDITMYP